MRARTPSPEHVPQACSWRRAAGDPRSLNGSRQEHAASVALGSVIPCPPIKPSAFGSLGGSRQRDGRLPAPTPGIALSASVAYWAS